MPSNLFQKRVKRFAQHSDSFQFYGDAAERDNQINTIRDMDIGVVNEVFRAGWKPVPTQRRLFRIQKAQFNDPLCLYAILEQLVISRPGIYVRAEYLDQPLTHTYPQYFWPVGTIGRMMAGLSSTCQVEYEPVAQYQVPFDHGRDARGTYYVIDPMGGDEGFLWLLRCRNIMLEKVQEHISHEMRGDFEWGGVGWTQPSVLYYDWFADTRIRDADAYKSQWRFAPPPGRPRTLDVTDDPFVR